MEFRTKGGENNMKQDYPGIDLVLARVLADSIETSVEPDDNGPA